MKIGCSHKKTVTWLLSVFLLVRLHLKENTGTVIREQHIIYWFIIAFRYKETRFWPLKKGIPTDEELSHLADNMPQDWKRLGVALGLKEKYLNAIEMNKPNDVFERALAVLQKWKKKMGRKATYHKLAEALNDQLVRRPDLVKRYSTDLEG